MTTAMQSRGADPRAPRDAHHDHATTIIRSFTTASVVASATWLVLWFVPLSDTRSGFGFGTCGSVANPSLGPCRPALEQQAMFGGLALGVAAFFAIMAVVYAKTRGPLRDGPQPIHWVLAGIGSLMLMSAWLGVVMGTIDAVFSIR